MLKKTLVSLGLCGCIALTACSSGSGESPAPGGNSGEDGSIVVASFGGDTDKFLEESVHTYLSEYGDVTPVLDAGEDDARITQLQTEAEADAGSWDVVALNDADMAELIEQGLFQKLDTSKIANFENIQEGLENDYCVPHIVSPLTMIYDEDTVSVDSSTWESIFSDEYLGSMGTTEGWADFLFYASAILEAGGDPGSDMSPGFDRVRSIASQPLSYGSTTQLGQGLMSGEVNATVGTRARAAMWADASGKNLTSVIPDEGTFATSFYYCIPSNAKNVDGAHAYLDALLDPRGQQYFAENFYYAPTVTNADLDPEIQEAVGISDEEAERMWHPDMADISAQTVDFRRVWQEGQ